MLKLDLSDKAVEPKVKKSLKDQVKYWSLLNLGILMMAVGIYFFKSPNGFATGGVSGISIVLARLFAPFNIRILTQANIMLAINVLLLIIGFLILGKECGEMTVFCSITLSLENMLFVLPYFVCNNCDDILFGQSSLFTSLSKFNQA